MPRKKPTRTDIKKLQKALEASGGSVSSACKLAGISRNEFYSKYATLPEIVKTREECYRIGFTEVTEVLYQKCLQGDTKAMALYLKYNPVAKAERWIDSQTLVLKEEKPLTDSEKESLRKELFG